MQEKELLKKLVRKLFNLQKGISNHATLGGSLLLTQPIKAKQFESLKKLPGLYIKEKI